jgi:UDP-glucose 4-epimerase
VRDYLYIDDFCLAMDDVISFGKAGQIYNIGSGTGYTLNNVLALIKNIILNDSLLLAVTHLPSRPFDVIYNVLDHRKLSGLNNWCAHTSLANGIEVTWKWIVDNCS